MNPIVEKGTIILVSFDLKFQIAANLLELVLSLAFKLLRLLCGNILLALTVVARFVGDVFVKCDR